MNPSHEWIEIDFVSWGLLFKQIIACLLIPIGILIVIWLKDTFGVEDDKWSIKQPSPPTHVSFQFRESALQSPPSGPKKTKDISYDIQKALSARTTQFVKCPYCNQNNKTDALACEHCGGQL
jgi:hypothetical protein